MLDLRRTDREDGTHRKGENVLVEVKKEKRREIDFSVDMRVESVY